MNTKTVPLYLPSDLVSKIEKYQQQNYISTRNAAIIQLITTSLNEHKQQLIKGGQ